MAGIKDQEHIDELKRRLYERGASDASVVRHTLTPRPTEVSRGWGGPAVTETVAQIAVAAEVATTLPPLNKSTSEPIPDTDNTLQLPVAVGKKRRRYRVIILLASVLFFILTAAISSTYLFFGSNQISAKNISLTVSVPFAIAGGEVLPIQVSVSNQNSVAIDSAVLIVNYPAGTRSVEEGKDLYEERIAVDTVDPGEAINIPVRAILSGEENEDKELRVSIEYRVEGSNGTFFKEAAPQLVKISSSPVVLRVLGVDTISSGQELELRVQVRSNAPTVQKNVIISASYPNSFSFIKSEPEPAYNKNSWLITELKPEETYEIVVKGLVTGLVTEVSEIQIKAGNSQIDNQFIMGAILSQSKFSYTVEKPFTGVVVDVNGDKDGQVILSPGVVAEVNVSVTNTLDEPIYDMRVELKPRGNLIRDNLFAVTGGVYDTGSQIIRYEAADSADLAQVDPGETREFTFTVTPDPKQATASFDVSINVYAERVNTVNAAESLIGTGVTEVKYSSVATLGSQAAYTDGSFTGSGPVPPVVGKKTTYTITWVATAGANDLSDVSVTAKLPQAVTWDNVTTSGEKVEFNSESKQITWKAGEVAALGRKVFQFQVTLLPIATQIGRTAVLVGPQELKATDRFTGIPLRSALGEQNNELSTEFGFVSGNGVIISAENN
jgi:Domain of unknown function DUF11